jgi:hypothetical protein
MQEVRPDGFESNPSEQLRHELDALIGAAGKLQDPLEEIGRLGARLIIQQALEDKLTRIGGSSTSTTSSATRPRCLWRGGGEGQSRVTLSRCGWPHGLPRRARDGVQQFLSGLREQLKEGSYRPGAVRERSSPKRGGKRRRLGIRTVADRW